MNQSISNAMLFYLVITFVVILLSLFVGSLSYSKASKVNNRIVEEIEKYAENDPSDVENAYTRASAGILEWLNHGDDANGTGIGYRQVANGQKRCPDENTVRDETGGNVERVDQTSTSISNPYEYCVYRINSVTGTKRYTYYRVITYMYFDVPVVADILKIPVTGETMGFQEKQA